MLRFVYSSGLSQQTIFVYKICKYDIEKSITREMSGDLKSGMLAIGTVMVKVLSVIRPQSQPLQSVIPFYVGLL